MKKLVTLVGATALLTAFSASANAADVVVMKFRADECVSCPVMENSVDTAVAMVGQEKVKSVTIDISNAALWEKSAHEAFDADVVPVFNTYVGLTGFTAVVDKKTRKAIGCVNENYNANDVAELIKRAANIASTTRASTPIQNFRCPPAFNKLP